MLTYIHLFIYSLCSSLCYACIHSSIYLFCVQLSMLCLHAFIYLFILCAALYVMLACIHDLCYACMHSSIYPVYISLVTLNWKSKLKMIFALNLLVGPNTSTTAESELLTCPSWSHLKSHGECGLGRSGYMSLLTGTEHRQRAAHRINRRKYPSIA